MDDNKKPNSEEVDETLYQIENTENMHAAYRAGMMHGHYQAMCSVFQMLTFFMVILAIIVIHKGKRI